MTHSSFLHYPIFYAHRKLQSKFRLWSKTVAVGQSKAPSKDRQKIIDLPPNLFSKRLSGYTLPLVRFDWRWPQLLRTARFQVPIEYLSHIFILSWSHEETLFWVRFVLFFLEETNVLLTLKRYLLSQSGKLPWTHYTHSETKNCFLHFRQPKKLRSIKAGRSYLRQRQAYVLNTKIFVAN